MPDTARTLAALQTLLANNTAGDISEQDVRDFLLSVFPQTARGDIAVLDNSSLQARLALGADHRFLGSDGSDAVYRNIGWDAILSPTGTNDAARIQTVIDAGARRILLLDGTWDVSDQNVTWDSTTGLEIHGQTRANTILDFGSVFRSFAVSDSGFLGNLTVKDSKTDGSQSAITAGVNGVTIWNIDFDPTSGNGLTVKGGTSARTRVVNCIFQGVPDALTGQIQILKPNLLLITGCEFLGASAAGSAIQNIQPVAGADVFPGPNIVITGCYGRTLCAQGWFDDSGASRKSTVTITGNSIATNGAALAIDIGKAQALISANSFLVSVSQTAAASMIAVSGGSVVITNNTLEANSTRTDVIDISDSVGKHVITGNLILGGSGNMTNAIHLAGTGDNHVVTSNRCDGTDIRIASGSTGNVVALNIVNAIVGSTTANQIAANVTGV